MEDRILELVLDFNWGGYGFDELEELARHDPKVGIFDALAAHIAGAVKGNSCGCV